MAGTPASSRGGAGIAESLLDAKGDLIAASAADAAARVAVGANGTVLTANSVQTAGVEWATSPIYVVKTADESLSANAVLQNDDALLFAIGASATLVVFYEAWLFFVGANATMDIQFGWTGPAGATMLWAPLSDSTTAPVAGWGRRAASQTNQPPVSIATAITGATGAGTDNVVVYAGLVFGGGTAGNIQLQWAQNTSDAGTLTVKAGSFLRHRTLIA